MELVTERAQRGLSAATEVVSVQFSVQLSGKRETSLHNTFRGFRLGNTNKIKDLELLAVQIYSSAG